MIIELKILMSLDFGGIDVNEEISKQRVAKHRKKHNEHFLVVGE